MPHKQSQAASHCPHAYTRGSKPNIRYSKSIHATAQPYRRLGRAPWPGQTPMCERASRNRARLCDHRALPATYHRTQLGAETTTAPKMGAKLPAQGTQGRSEAIAHERHNARAQAHTHHRTTTSTASAPALAAVARSQGCRAPRRSRLPHMPHLWGIRETEHTPPGAGHVVADAQERVWGIARREVASRSARSLWHKQHGPGRSLRYTCR